jgi:hypothetical protein
MAKVKIQGHASGTGILTVTAPNTSTDRTITLPDATGTLLNSDGDGSSLTGIATPITALNNATANELVTVGSTTTELDAESGLTFDGTVLHTNAGTSGASTHGATRIRIEDDTHCGLEITTPNTSEQYIMFSDPQGQAGEIKYNHATNLMNFSSTGSHKFVTAGATTLNIDSAGIITKPLQPAFHIHPNASQLNFARGAVVAITFDTERFDLNNDFASSTFTAPVTGKYQLSASIALAAVNTDGGTNYYYIQIMTSNRSYYHLSDIARAGAVNWNLNCDVLADMDAGDTSSVKIIQGGSGGTGTSDVSSDSFFSGHLVC